MADTAGAFLSVRDLTVCYGAVKAVNGVCFEVPEGKLVALIGLNGAGKTSVLRVISGLKRPVAGSCWFQGGRIDGRPPYEIAKLGIIHVPEGRGLFGAMTVAENLQVGATPRRNSSRGEKERDLAEMEARFPILKKRGRQLAMNLSGGEASLLAVARSLMAKPKLLVMDEPLLGLAPIAIDNVLSTVGSLRDSGLSILMVEHNVAVTLEVADWVYVMDQGKIVLEGLPGEIKESDFVQKGYLSI